MPKASTNMYWSLTHYSSKSVMDYELWPTPRDWYLAKAAIRTETSWTLAEYEAMGDYPAAMNDGGNSDVPIEADFPMDTMTHTSAIPAAMPAATEEGGTVFLCKGLFLFFFISPRPGVPFFISYCFDYSLFKISFAFLSCFEFQIFYFVVVVPLFNQRVLESF